jgi:hypothetical protein
MKLRSGQFCGSPPKQLVQLPLTQQNLRAFDKSDGQTASSESKSVSSQSMPSSTDPVFPLLLFDNGVCFDNRHVLPPHDKNEILKHLQQERRTLDNLQSQDFLRRLQSSINEETYKVHFVHCLFQFSSRKLSNDYSMHMDLEWSKVAGTSVAMQNLSNPKPDYFETFSLYAYPPEARNDLPWYITPSAHMFAMPTFCVEFKAPGKGPRNAIAQAAYDGAVMVDAAWEMHKYMKKPARDFFGTTKALVITISDRCFELFACHAMPAVESKGKSKDEYPPKIKYHIFQLIGSKIDSADNVKAICLSIRNAQDWCYAQARSVKENLCKHSERLKKKEMQEERKKNDARRIASDAERKEKGKRKMDEADLEQGQQEWAAKRRKTRDSSGISGLSSSSRT